MFGLAHRGWSLHDVGYTSALAGVQHVADNKDGNAWERIGYHRCLDIDRAQGEDDQ